ncbi:MAG: isoquinoline 1-oxidoreductase subunit beta [Solirubrobacteraceae bacterium]|nr:isoquinoline 1-oxidoreductase subunit beta [Solirubrobacteraceae bacterium]
MKERADDDRPGGREISRRRFIGYLIAAPTLVAAADLTVAQPAWAAIPTAQPIDLFDANDALNAAVAPTSQLISVIVNGDGTVSFDLPRVEVGQGITTAIAMTIAEELDVAVDAVRVTLADARPELVFNQLTAGSNTMHSMFTPVRVASAVARARLLVAAAQHLGVPRSGLSVHHGVVTGPGGERVTYGELAARAAAAKTTRIPTLLKPRSSFKVIGTRQRRIDARAIVTGSKPFTMDHDVPGALPTMICRPPTINGTVAHVQNLADVRAMPGIEHVVVVARTTLVPGGVAVCGTTFGHCIDAVRALEVTWNPGPLDGTSEDDVLAVLDQAELPLAPAAPLATSIERVFTFHFTPGEPLETNCAIADVRSDRAEIWTGSMAPITVQEQLANTHGLAVDRVTVHVAPGGGSFGRNLIGDAAYEAAAVSKAIGKPVKLLWHRTDGLRQGRAHPMSIIRVRATYLGRQVLTFDQRNSGVKLDVSGGFGEAITAGLSRVLDPGLSIAEAAFSISQNVPYNFGAVTQLLTESYPVGMFNTGSLRQVFSPDGATARELIVDELAEAMRMDPCQFRRAFVRDRRLRAVLDEVARAGRWGRSMPAGTAQGVAIHKEHKGAAACLVEIDCRKATVNRVVKDGFTGPRVTKVVFAVDVGLAINPLGVEAQITGAIMDGIAQALTYSLHLVDGRYLEGSWDHAYYTRQWNAPRDVEVIVMPSTRDTPGGAGEFGVGPAMAATACAYARATGRRPTRFPINHDRQPAFEPLPTIPPIPASPTNGLARAF